MDYTKENEDEDAKEGIKDDLYFVEDYHSSEGEGEIEFSHQKHHSSRKRAARLSRESSPPLVLAFNITSGRTLQLSSQSTTSSVDSQDEQEEEEEDSEQPIEDWMIVEGEDQVGDTSIQLNLSYWNSSEEDSGDEDQTVESVKDTWAISEKDKYGADQSLPSRYFVTGRSLTCSICNRTGHLAKSCYYYKQKFPTCVLCGIQGHIQRDCPGRPCPRCGLPSHGLRPCERPPVWKQHCHRCGMLGHLSDACPDTWRQYHLTIRLELPVRPWTVHTLKHKKCPAHCYNCSKRGHYGYECTKKRMISGTFPLLPYVCHYDQVEDILKHCTGKQRRAKELLSAGSLPLSDQQHLCELTGESGEDNQPVQGRSSTKQETCSSAGRRKTWPERRRERREVKKLRREAQARREGGLLGRSQNNFDDEICHEDPFQSALHSHKQSAPPPQKKIRDEPGGRSRKSREAERWKKRGGMKRGDLYPHGDTDVASQNLLSPKQRVRHRRR
ncbi:zinc finger CCHC domain-containing protein 7-like isoform X1 [Epinephelus fuscoguttatus]|uniref:zinc finger CCHC domain-containing protein 7-like isoform X1 n=1 Tax=Epinephelus fuscoguttatus TaxID=293821 RepID=UPI0020D01937|nr:zinc finger CCHC domain-containing protein 7-like isoform X1 [Epinephelus fuscoguttatus]